MKIYEPENEKVEGEELEGGMLFRDNDAMGFQAYCQIHRVSGGYQLRALDGMLAYNYPCADINDVFGVSRADFTRVHKVIIEN